MSDEPAIRLTLPVPPSANALFTYRAGSRQRIKTSEYRAWIAEAGYMIALGKRHWPGLLRPVGRCRVEMTMPVDHRRDISNCIKAVEDILVSQHVIKDDRWVDDLRVVRVAVVEPLVVSVWPMTP